MRISSDGLNFTLQKEMHFEATQKIRREDITIVTDAVDFTSEKKKSTSCVWKYSFTVITKQRNYVLFCRTSEEQFLWIRAFSRMLGVEFHDPNYKIPLQIL